MKGFGDSNAERNDRKRQSNNKELAMKKIISFLMVIVVSCSCCMLSFAADADSENNNLAKAYIEPRRAELVEVVSANYDCFDGKIIIITMSIAPTRFQRAKHWFRLVIILIE